MRWKYIFLFITAFIIINIIILTIPPKYNKTNNTTLNERNLDNITLLKYKILSNYNLKEKDISNLKEEEIIYLRNKINITKLNKIN